MDDGAKKIMAISLTSAERMVCYAACNGEVMVVDKVVPAPGGMFISWRSKLLDEIEERKAKGFTVVVEERSDFISSHGERLMLDEMFHDEGRIALFVAIDWYLAQQNMGNLIFPETAGRYRIQDSTFDRKPDDKGRIQYNIDYSKFNGGHRAVLLATLAAYVVNPMSDHYLEAFAREREALEAPKGDDRYARFRAVTVDYDNARAEYWERLESGN